MLIDPEKLFNNKVFNLNKNLTYKIVDNKLGKIGIIDNFYQDINLVLGELDKIPITLTYQIPENNNSLFDGRKTYKDTMPGMEIPYVNDLPQLISKIINHPSGFISIDKSIIVNCFKYTEKLKYDLSEYYYTIHTDPSNSHQGQKGQLAIVLFLNNNYEDGEGMNFYLPYKEPELFTSKKDIEFNYFVQGKCNRAVLFNSNLFHGQHTPTQQFKNEMRYTQVIFCPLF